jgi:hypothetical protein
MSLRREKGERAPHHPRAGASARGMTMPQAITAIAFLVLAYTVLILFGERLPPAFARGLPFLVPLVGLAAAAWAFAPNRKRQP